jgi:hypothetical protein
LTRTLAWTLLTILSLGETACGDCRYGFTNVYTVCSDAGTGVLESPDGLAVAGPLEVRGDCNKSCESFAEVWFGSARGGGLPLFSGGISLGGLTGKPPFTIDLGPGSTQRTSFSLAAPDGATTQLSIVEGTIVVTSRTSTSFAATFSATVETPAGERVIIRSATINVSGCHGEEICTDT